MAWCEGMEEPRVMICPLGTSNSGKGQSYKSAEGCLMSLIHPKNGNATSYLLKDGLVQEIHCFKQSYGSWFLGEYICEDGSLYISTPVDPIFILLPIFSNARLKKGKGQGMFRQLDEILYVSDHPSYQCLMTIAEESMPLVCEVKEIGSFKFFRLDDSKVLSWLCCKVRHLKATLKQLDEHYAAQEERETLKEVVSILGEYIAYDPWLGLLCDHLELDINEEVKETQRFEDELILLDRSMVSSHPLKVKGSNGKAKSNNGKQTKKLKVETDSRNIKDMFSGASRARRAV
ncbi:hypothetical protein AXF42_Ash018437 [Apostasia shenzhenica]|uniref:Ribonuclease H2 subunit B n=1 Tax=Apostasia shenzhenica TaxID=1088818 RepID=A0A2I0BEB1_9ASPA|nr:hypothetical protein AXF42_Ash018437 [Apostasia shenzhenica]